MRLAFSLAAMVLAGIVGTSSAALAEVSTGITASANGWDTRIAGYGCAPSGCIAGNVLDDSIEAVLRWSCNAGSSEVDACELTLVLDEPTDVTEMRISLYKGDQRTRSLNVLVDGDLVNTIETSGTTAAYEMYELNVLQATTIVLQAAGMEDNGWLSITGIQLMADYDLEVLPPSPTPSGDGYLGCYSDIVGDRVLTSVEINEDLTSEACAATCAETGKFYYALQQGNECWCAGCYLTENETNTDYDRHGEGSCSTPCAGDSSSTCGGDMAFSLYQTTSCVDTPAPTPGSYSYTSSDTSSSTSVLDNIPNLPQEISDAIFQDASGGFAGPGFIEIDGYDVNGESPFILAEDEAGTLELSGIFMRYNESELPASAAVFVYIDNVDAPDDYAVGQADLDPSTGEFSVTISDFLPAYTRLILSFVVLDPADTLEGANGDSVFPLTVVNNGCSSPLTLTLDWDTDDTNLNLWVNEPGGARVYFAHGNGDVGYLYENAEFVGPETYVVYGGLGDVVLGEYTSRVNSFSTPYETAWTLTARSEGEVLWVEEGIFSGSSSSTTDHDTTSSPTDDDTTDDDTTSRRLFSFYSDSSPNYSDDSFNRWSAEFIVTLDSYTDVQC